MTDTEFFNNRYINGFAGLNREIGLF